jgi:hypothetical protein
MLSSWLDEDHGIVLAGNRPEVIRAKEDWLEHRAREIRRSHRPPGVRRPNEQQARQQAAHEMTEGHLVAELPFGFWTRFLSGKHDNWRDPVSQVWPTIQADVFPYFNNGPRVRSTFHDRLMEIKALRNRVFHHERVTKPGYGLSKYDLVVSTVGWMNPDVERMLRAIDRPKVVAMFDRGAGPHREWLGLGIGGRSSPDSVP